MAFLDDAFEDQIENFSEHYVDESVKENADFQYETGMKPKVIRISSGHCCAWCADIAGEYEYPNVPDDVYHRHSNCDCSVDYLPGDGRRQDVWSKRWQANGKSDKLESRKKYDIELRKKTPQEINLEIAIKYSAKDNSSAALFSAIVDNHEALESYTPAQMKKLLEDAGYNVKPLNKGSLKGAQFEKGGGYKVNFGKDGIFQYHPATMSHHGGEYWKVTKTEGGIWYDRAGKEIRRTENRVRHAAKRTL